MMNVTKLEQITNSSALVSTLIELGVDSIFGYPGASVLSIYNELSKTKKIQHYLVRHEQAAVHAAEGYARVSGKIGVVLVTSGPGFTNTLTGIANAYADSTPLVVLAGDVSDNISGEKIFQDVDIKSIASSCCKKVYVLKADDDINMILKDAFYTANSGKKGPVVLVLPRNILESEFQAISDNSITFKKNYENINEDKLIQILDEISYSKKPLILLGGGCLDASKEIEKFVSKLQIPVISTLMGIGVYPSENSLYLGMIGLNGNEIANKALEECDLLISLGTAFSDRSTCKKENFSKNLKIININIIPTCSNALIEELCDVKEFVEKMLAKVGNFSVSFEKWLYEIDMYKTDYQLEKISSNKLSSAEVLRVISEYTKYYEPVVVTDVGQHQMLTAQFFNFNKPRKFITSGGLGSMGFGLPAAMGANIASPENLILNITGDGSFQMNLQELATCREHNLPVKIIIMNNSYLGMVRQLQEKIYKKCYQVEMINPDFTKIAEAYDLFAIRVNKIDELIPALEKSINHNGTAIIDIIIDSFENI